MSQPACAEAPIAFSTYSYSSPVSSPSTQKGHIRKRSSGTYSVNTSPLQRLRQSTIGATNLSANLENATAALSRPPGRGIFSRLYVLAASLVVFIVVGLSISTNPNYYLSTAYKQQLMQELSRLPDSVRSIRLPDNVKSYLVTSDPSICAAAAADAVEAKIRTLPVAPVDSELPPLAAGFGAISLAKNPTRNRFLVPIYSCDEQETGAQMHIRQVLHLSKALNRTAILPNFGGMQIPTLSNCQPYAFDDIYDLEQANAAELWSASYPTFERYINRTMNGREESISAQLGVVFSREAFKQIQHLDGSDADILRQSCVDPDPYDLKSPTLYVATEPQEPIERVVAGLKSAEDKDVLFVYFNHKSQFSSPQIIDPLLVDRPEFGLWSHAPFPYWNYSSTIDDIYHYALNQMPEDYVAIQWRLERVPPPILNKCSNMFVEEVIAGARRRKVSTVYIASDAPVRPGEGFKSASWDSAYQDGVQSAMGNLVNSLEAADLKVVTWKDVRPKPDSQLALSSLGENSSGIFDRLMVGKSASWIFVPNTNCGMKSAYLGSIQTLRQDRIGDPTETDWEKLAMTWIGEPIPGKFWWNVDPEWENWDKVEQ